MRGVVIETLADIRIKKQMQAAEVNHCLSFEQVSDEIFNFKRGFTIRIRAIWRLYTEKDIYWIRQGYV